jgi:methylenetetrahydrofolate reductase (NADPH)
LARDSRIAADVPEIGVPDQLIHDLEADRDAGVDVAVAVAVAVSMIDTIRHSGAFGGVHLVPVGRYADIAARLRKS